MPSKRACIYLPVVCAVIALEHTRDIYRPMNIRYRETDVTNPGYAQVKCLNSSATFNSSCLKSSFKLSFGSKYSRARCNILDWELNLINHRTVWTNVIERRCFVETKIVTNLKNFQALGGFIGYSSFLKVKITAPVKEVTWICSAKGTKVKAIYYIKGQTTLGKVSDGLLCSFSDHFLVLHRFLATQPWSS